MMQRTLAWKTKKGREKNNSLVLDQLNLRCQSDMHELLISAGCRNQNSNSGEKANQ